MTKRSGRRPRNQLGQLATRTPQETIARLEEKALENRGSANRQRIRVQVEEARALGEANGRS